MPNKSFSTSTIQYSVLEFVTDLIKLIQPYKAKFLLGAFLRLSSDVVNLYPTFALSRLVVLLTDATAISAADKTQEAIWLLVGWLVAVMYHSVAHQSAKWLGYQVSERVALDTRLQAFRHIFSLDISWQEKEKIGNKIKRIDHGSRALDGTIRIFFNVIIEACLNSISIFLIFLALDLHLAITMFIFMVVYFILSSILTKRAAHQAYVVNQYQEDLEGFSYEALNNIKTVKSLSIHRAILSSLNSYTNQTYGAIQKRVALFQYRNGALSVFYFIFEVGMISYIVYQILQGEFSAAILVLFVGYFGKVEEAVFELADVAHELVINKLQFYRLKEILLTLPTIEGTRVSQQQVVPENWKKIEFKNVTFSYGQKKVLLNFNLTINRGQKIGIVGLSGAGKSTLFSLLLDLYEDYEGEILIDDISLTNISRQDYINHLSVVLQDTELFNLTLRENILIGAQPQEKPDEERILKSIQNAHLQEVVERLPEGMHTVIGEKGVKLSGGEKQRLGIARALYRQPDLLLMDEATSHLDVDSERKIQASLHQFFQRVTAVVIAHRLSTIKEMDEIVVMHEGKIIERGSFKQLINQAGAFAQLWEKQRL
ncbi:MAG: ABC transporter ATP-binding protein [Patescibacteria group bacterium]